MKGWLDKYQGGGNVAVSDATRTKVTKNTGIKKGADQPVSNMLDITLNAPQRQLVKMITGKEQYPSEAMGITNPWGAFAVDAVLDPTNLVGAGLAKKAISSAIKKKATKPNWAKWNKEIPGNKPLMQEYKAIEKNSKANGSWMKNADGSVFKGTPEQFVQQRSEERRVGKECW